jgi:plastocyanin
VLVRLRGHDFDRDNLSLERFARVVFQNDDAVDHAVVITLRGSPPGSRVLDDGLQPGTTTETVLGFPGTYDVWDRFFGGPGTGMHMTIIVHGPTPTNSPAGLVNVTLTDGQYSPAILDVQAYQTVHFLNQGTTDHTVTIVPTNSPPGTFELDSDLQPGGIGTYTFANAGTYDVYCRHDGGPGTGMHMTVHVA